MTGHQHSYLPIYEFGRVDPVAYICGDCGARGDPTDPSQPDLAVAIERERGKTHRMIDRIRKVEAKLPPTPLERRAHNQCRDDLLDLLDELS